MKNVTIILFMLLQLPFYALSYDLIVPDTGQDLCYDWTQIIDCPNEGEDFYGQDGSYTIRPPDLTDNGDGTVTDNLTGLMWEQKTLESETLSYTYPDAVAYCNDLTLGNGNHSDWRVPTRKAYSTILNYGRVSPSLDTLYFPYYTSVAYYWTTSEYHDDPSQVWVVRLTFGLIDKLPKTPDLYRVRCVRGTTEPIASYTDNGDDTVTDNLTGLMWEQKTDDEGSRDKDNTYTWKDGLAYCENLILSAYADWRLPTPKELERLVDLDSSGPAIDTTYFPHTGTTSNKLYWTGTTCSGCHKMKAFAVDFSDGELYYGNKYRNDVYDTNYVRCVRHPDPDNDGVIYPNDNCPYFYNPSQQNSDGDVIGDACDNCPYTSSSNQEDEDDDEVGDVCDNCPNHPNGSGLGTCTKDFNGIIIGTGVTCTTGGSECGDGESCQLEQGDWNDNDIGDVCECYADLDSDGLVYPGDAMIMLEEWGREDCLTNPPCEADIDGDGLVYPSDAMIMLEQWGKEDCPIIP